MEFCVYNSVLSEMAVVGFEYGNSIVDPTFLTVWEAQFGDFANGAQIMIDQFLSSGESKWQRLCGMVMLLPHGYEGQGPEHSSARLERFLQLCAQDNMQVVNMTTPAQLFHVLRRQVKRQTRKPLVIMSPKSLLRHPRVQSTIDVLVNGQFHEVIDDSLIKNAEAVQTVCICSGKVYYELLEQQENHPQKEKYALLRLEQLYPFPENHLLSILKRYTQSTTLRWVQEEPKNMGAWRSICQRLQQVIDKLSDGRKALQLQYVGRSERASPATGSPQKHVEEQNKIVSESFQV